MTEGLMGILGQALLLAVNTSDVSTWVTCICSAIITIATCLLQVYRMVRDRDDDDADSTDEVKEGDEDNGEETKL